MGQMWLFSIQVVLLVLSLLDAPVSFNFSSHARLTVTGLLSLGSSAVMADHNEPEREGGADVTTADIPAIHEGDSQEKIEFKEQTDVNVMVDGGGVATNGPATPNEPTEQADANGLVDKDGTNTNGFDTPLANDVDARSNPPSADIDAVDGATKQPAGESEDDISRSQASEPDVKREKVLDVTGGGEGAGEGDTSAAASMAAKEREGDKRRRRRKQKKAKSKRNEGELVKEEKENEEEKGKADGKVREGQASREA